MSAFSMGLIVCRDAKTIRFLPAIFYKDKRAAARRRRHKDDLDDYRAKIRDSLPAIPAKAGIQRIADAVNGRLSFLTPLSSL